MSQPSNTLPDERWFEDYVVGATYELGSFTMTEDEIVIFARDYDPQTMHIDRAWAAQGPFGGIIASGWHTIGKLMHLYVAGFLPHNGLASPGIDELRWLRPVRPGDLLSVRATITDKRVSRSKPDRGMLHPFVEVLNQHGEVVLTMKPLNLVPTRPLAGGA